MKLTYYPTYPPFHLKLLRLAVLWQREQAAQSPVQRRQ
jgi:hypothetical protein